MKLLIAATIAVAFGSSAASAACLHWNAAGEALSLEQSNAVSVGFKVIQRGDDLSGTARAVRSGGTTKILGVWAAHDPVINNGNVDGTLKGSKARFKVMWDDGHIGVYDLNLDEDGRFTGTTYDFHNPSGHHAQVIGFTKLSCGDPVAPSPTPAPSGPVHHLGKRPTDAPPVTEGDVARARTSQLPSPAPAMSNACASGFVWRNARPGDLVCVPPASRTRAAEENAQSSARWNPAGAYGPKTCVSGYVWREAFAGDQVCVTPAARDVTRQENNQGSARRAN